MNNVAVILAAGNSSRMKSDKSKLLLPLNGKTVIERTVELFSSINEVDEIIVVCRECDLERFEAILDKYDITYCFGGSTRQQSVTNAIESIDEYDKCGLVIIHDGARPLVTREEVAAVIKRADICDAAALGVSVKDTIKVVNEHNIIVDTPDRDKLIAVRTPQAFDLTLYKKALDRANKEGKDFTDDCAVAENDGLEVAVIKSSYENIKITTPEDVLLAEAILKSRSEH